MNNPVFIFIVVWIVLFFTIGLKRLDKLPKSISFYIKIYSFYTAQPLTKQKMSEIEKLLGLFQTMSREEIIIKSTETMTKFLVSLVFLVGATIALFGNPVITLTAVILCNAIMNINTDIKADKLYYKYIVELRLAVDIIISEFKFTGDVSRTLINVRGRTFITPVLSRLYNVINSTSMTKELDLMELIDTPIKPLKDLLSLMYITAVEGDGKTKNGMSALETSLMVLRQDITNEIEAIELRRELFGSLRGITLVPTFFMPALVSFMASNMPITQPVYNSFYGYFMQMFILVGTYMCYNFVHQNGRNSVVTQDDRSKILYNIVKSEKLDRLIKPLVPIKYEKLKKLECTLDEALSQKTPIYIYHQKVLVATGAFLSSIVLVITFSLLSAQYFMDDIELKALVNRNPIDRYTAKALKDYDMEVLAMDWPPDEIEVRAKIRAIMPNISALDLGNEINRVLVKYDQYRNGIGLKWYYSILVILITVAAWFYADFTLWMRKRLVVREVEADLNCINSILCLLSTTKLSVRDTIFWMYIQSDIFKRVLYRGFIKYTSDPTKVIPEMLQQSVNNEFKQTLVALEKAVLDVPLGRALSTIYEIKGTQAAESHRRTLKSIREKYNDAKFAAFGPTISVIFMLLIVPLGYTAYVLITASLNNL